MRERGDCTTTKAQKSPMYREKRIVFGGSEASGILRKGWYGRLALLKCFPCAKKKFGAKTEKEKVTMAPACEEEEESVQPRSTTLNQRRSAEIQHDCKPPAARSETALPLFLKVRNLGRLFRKHHRQEREREDGGGRKTRERKKRRGGKTRELAVRTYACVSLQFSVLPAHAVVAAGCIDTHRQLKLRRADPGCLGALVDIYKEKQTNP